jgi:hypothetical protein
MTSPYEKVPVEQWESKTRELIALHPLNTDEIHEIALRAWDDILQSNIGTKPFRIGKDIFPAPQIMGFLLHELFALELSYRYPEQWRKGNLKGEKDAVYIPDDSFSIEIKTSSNPKHIFGNRSYAQVGAYANKEKSGYYLAINFQKFLQSQAAPQLQLVRFGWLDHSDWIGQAAVTGQQARLNPISERAKLLTLPLGK